MSLQIIFFILICHFHVYNNSIHSFTGGFVLINNGTFGRRFSAPTTSSEPTKYPNLIWFTWIILNFFFEFCFGHFNSSAPQHNSHLRLNYVCVRESEWACVWVRSGFSQIKTHFSMRKHHLRQQRRMRDAFCIRTWMGDEKFMNHVVTGHVRPFSQAANDEYMHTLFYFHSDEQFRLFFSFWTILVFGLHSNFFIFRREIQIHWTHVATPTR